MPAFIQDLERQAQAAARNEADFRLQMRDRLAQLEAARVAAYRRLNLLKGMASAVAAAAEEAVALEAGVDHVCTRTDWSAANAAYAEVRARLIPVAVTKLAAEHPPADAPAPAQKWPKLAFTSFEAWYRARFNVDFLSLLASDAPTFQSVVDF